MHRTFAASLLLLVASSTGCITIAGGVLPPIEPTAPSAPATVEDTVGDFSFTLEGGKMVTDNKQGRLLNDEILARWKKQAYISEHEYVPSSEFTGKADYNLTLSGSQYGESSIAMQLLSGFTLLLLPYSVDTRYDIQYTLEDVKTGRKFSAAVEDNYKTWIELLLFVAIPFSMGGASRTWDNMADHLYEQLRAQGAFGVHAGSAPTGIVAEEAHP
jgi:hypothetical protein